MEDICSEKVNGGDKEEMLSGRECKPASSKETSLVLCEPHLGRLSIGNSNGTHRDPPEIKSGRKFCLERVEASLLVTCELLPRPGRLANATHATANGRHSHTHPPSPLLSTIHLCPRHCHWGSWENLPSIPSERCLFVLFLITSPKSKTNIHTHPITSSSELELVFSFPPHPDLSELVARFAQSSGAVFAELTFAQSPLPLFPTLLRHKLLHSPA